MDEQVEVPVSPAPRKRRGWPKGKPRGPRKPLPMTPPPSQEPIPTPAPLTPTPEPAHDPETEVELVSVSAHLSSGADLAFKCSLWSQEPDRWEFVSYPKRRGFKTLRVFRSDTLASVEIEAPEPFFDRFKPIVAAPVPAPFSSGTGSLALVPQVHVSPAQQLVRDARANQARRIGGVKSEIVGEEGGRAVVGATMLGPGEI